MQMLRSPQNQFDRFPNAVQISKPKQQMTTDKSTDGHMETRP